MNIHLTLILLISLGATQESTWGVPENQNVAILTSANFNDFIRAHELVMVKFYAPWCSHCKSMAPAYASLAIKMKMKGVPVAKVDGTVETELAVKYNISAYPTLAVFRNGFKIEYKGQRTEEAMVNYLNEKIKDEVNEIITEFELDIQKDKKLSLVFFMSKGDQIGLKLVKALRMIYEDIPVSYSYNNELKKKYDESKYVLLFLRKYDEGNKMMVLDKEPELDNIKRFIDAFRFQMVMELDEKAAERIYTQKKSVIILFSDKVLSDALDTFKSFADEHREVFYAHSKISSGFGTKMAQFFGITQEDDPAVRILDFQNNNYNKHKVETIDSEGLLQALNDYKKGKLSAYYKSEPMPLINNKPVKIVVGDNFDELVINNDKFVLLEAFAPWCGHCKKLEPVYNELAELLKDEIDLVIAKIDGTANEHKTILVQGFPTIYLFRPGAKLQPEKYEGARELGAIKSYLEEKMGRKLAEERKVTEEL